MSFKLVLRVKRKSEPLILNVKANGYTMSTCVQVEKADGGFREISPNHTDTLDFGKVWSHIHGNTDKRAHTNSLTLLLCEVQM